MRFNVKRYFQVLGISLAVIAAVFAVGMGMDFDALLHPEKDNSNKAVVEAADDKINVLIMCVDIDGLRTDSIMLAQYDTQANSIKMLSIPRDTRLFVGNRYQKINAAHAYIGEDGEIGGAEATCEAVTRLTGVPINYYIGFTFDAIAHVVNDVGPVTFTIPDVHGDGEGMVYDDPVQGLHINLPPGTYDLDGSQVVQMLRYRKNNYGQSYLNGDRDRIALLQDFLKAFVDQKMNASLILKIPAIFKDVMPEIETNVGVSDVIKYSKYLTGFSSSNMTSFQLPGTDANDSVNGSVWVPNLEEIRTLVSTEFGYDAANITVEAPNGGIGVDSDSYEYGTYNDNLSYEDGYYDAEFDADYDVYDD
ncbi:MAG TPA: LCP family protein [Candidatus Ornithomonoglobus intestinigallinarum]|uniref:LCP family protein n=1 Tax=Candidatus Ornithomonoglobus intestinigallinarum TaxID=2840894 RepID=A0A9D1KRL4_9FIRM|nr:LCP family protein [Candidatus Ornithomonoglobus intestinigallinarum]